MKRQIITLVSLIISGILGLAYRINYGAGFEPVVLFVIGYFLFRAYFNDMLWGIFD